MLARIAQLIDTLPTGWRIQRTRHGAAASTRADLQFLDMGDCLIRMRCAGSRGPSLVLATDPPVPLELYDNLLAVLSDRYRITIFELPGFGCSLPRAGYQLSLPQAIHTVARLLEQLPGAPHVLGLPCVTGFIAIGIARSHPRLIKQLLLLQTPTWNAAQHWLASRDPTGLLRRPILGQLALLAMRRHRVRQWYAGALANPALVAPFAAATLENFEHGGCFCLASGFQNFLRHHHDLLGAVQQEALIVWGGADRSHRHTDMAATAELAPNSRFEILADAGHFPELEAGDRFVSLLDDFLEPERKQ